MPNETNVVAINDLTEKTTAVGQDDLLVIAEKVDDAYITKSIKATSVGGGGGGGADDFVVNFTITPPDSATSTTTFAQIKSAYDQGKNIRAKGAATGVGDVIFNLAHISDSDVVFIGFVEFAAGEGYVGMTVRGNSSGYSMYIYR